MMMRKFWINTMNKLINLLTIKKECASNCDCKVGQTCIKNKCVNLIDIYK